jgi:hypothetical protein
MPGFMPGIHVFFPDKAQISRRVLPISDFQKFRLTAG